MSSLGQCDIELQMGMLVDTNVCLGFIRFTGQCRHHYFVVQQNRQREASLKGHSRNQPGTIAGNWDKGLGPPAQLPRKHYCPYPAAVSEYVHKCIEHLAGQGLAM